MDPNDPSMRAYMDEEEKQRQRALAGMSIMGSAPNAPARPSAGAYDAAGIAGQRAMATPDPRAAVPPAGPGGIPAPTYGQSARPPAPTNAAPGSAMGMQPRPDPYGRSAPAMGAAQFAPAPQAAGMGAMMGASQAAPGMAAQSAPSMAAQAAPAAAGAATAGSAAAPGVAVLMQFLDKKRQEDEIRKKARQDLQSQYAASLGYPQARVGAAAANSAAGKTEGADYLRYLLPFMGGKGAAG
jgi:hypothetical protein